MMCHMAADAAHVAPLTEHDVRRGVPVTAVAAMAQALGLPLADVLEWLSIAPRTWARRKQVGVLDTLESDRVARLSRLVRRAGQVLGSAAQARVWLTTPNRSLQRRTPFEVASTEVGAETVFQLLGRIEHGVFG
jgi:putative toxin-antitoxin system antitoxin component (TIGR02293 family)